MARVLFSRLIAVREVETILENKLLKFTIKM